MRRCFDIDLRIQQRLSILMARDGDSARCMAHVFLMILVVPRSTYGQRIVIARLRTRITSTPPGHRVICRNCGKG